MYPPCARIVHWTHLIYWMQVSRSLYVRIVVNSAHDDLSPCFLKGIESWIWSTMSCIFTASMFKSGYILIMVEGKPSCLGKPALYGQSWTNVISNCKMNIIAPTEVRTHSCYQSIQASSFRASFKTTQLLQRVKRSFLQVMVMYLLRYAAAGRVLFSHDEVNQCQPWTLGDTQATIVKCEVTTPSKIYFPPVRFLGTVTRSSLQSYKRHLLTINWSSTKRMVHLDLHTSLTISDVQQKSTYHAGVLSSGFQWSLSLQNLRRSRLKRMSDWHSNLPSLYVQPPCNSRRVHSNFVLNWSLRIVLYEIIFLPFSVFHVTLLAERQLIFNLACDAICLSC